MKFALNSHNTDVMRIVHFVCGKSKWWF